MATKTVVNISPKVLTGGLFGLGIAVVEAVTVAATPHTLSFLGPWEPLAIAALPPLLGQVAAWFKKEEEAQRVDAQNGAQKVGPVPADIPAPATPAATAASGAIVAPTADQIIAGTPAAPAV